MKRLRIFLIFLTIACIAFIWINSSMNGDESSALSNGVLGVINSMLMSFGIKRGLSEFLIRKTAHFTEYTLLAVLLTIDFKLFNIDMKRQGFIVLFIGLLVAVVDETIQLIPVGRISSLIDVWIDFGGVCTGFIIVLIIWRILSKRVPV